MVENDNDYTKVGNKYWRDGLFIDNEDDLDLLNDGYIESYNKKMR